MILVQFEAVFLRCCVNAALYTPPVEINAAGFQSVTHPRRRHSIKPNELASRVTEIQSVTLIFI